jgi:nitroreductase
MSTSIAELNDLKQAPAVEGVLPIFHTRWSPRAFTDKEISSSDLAKLFEAARWTASSSNEQPWKFLVGTRGSETYSKILDALVPFNQSWAGKAAVLILGTTNTKNAKGDINAKALYDLGAATFALNLQAESQGLMAHQMGGYDDAKARKNFGIPADYVIGSVTAVGYQAEPESLTNAQLVEREKAPRERKPLSEIAFSAWDQPAPIG